MPKKLPKNPKIQKSKKSARVRTANGEPRPVDSDFDPSTHRLATRRLVDSRFDSIGIHRPRRCLSRRVANASQTRRDRGVRFVWCVTDAIKRARTTRRRRGRGRREVDRRRYPLRWSRTPDPTRHLSAHRSSRRSTDGERRGARGIYRYRLVNISA